jgi:hypothetical protein
VTSATLLASVFASSDAIIHSPKLGHKPAVRG